MLFRVLKPDGADLLGGAVRKENVYVHLYSADCPPRTTRHLDPVPGLAGTEIVSTRHPSQLEPGQACWRMYHLNGSKSACMVVRDE